MTVRRLMVTTVRVWSIVLASTTPVLAAEPTPKPPTEPAATTLPDVTPAPSPDSAGVAAATSVTIERSFRVRQALIGQGFDFGVSGRLSVGERGISFTREGGSVSDWSIAWRDLATAAPDEGIWDSPWPVLVVERSGLRRFVARIDRQNRHLRPEPLLEAINEGRQRFRRSRESVGVETGRKGVGP